MSGGISFCPIGVIHSGHQVAQQTPIQPVFAGDCSATVEIYDEFAAGLEGLGGFSHIFLFYVFHKREGMKLRVKPYMGDHETGVFSTRHPGRPNPLGMSVVKLEKIEGNILHISGADMLDGTPLIDLKPYIPKFDLREDLRGGWTDAVDDETANERGRRDFRGGSECRSGGCE